MLSFNFHPFPVLSTGRLLLRLIIADDAPEVFALRTDERVLRYIGKTPLKNMEEALALIETRNSGIGKNEAVLWGIALNSTNKLIGSIGLWNVVKEHFRAEIGYELHPDLHGKGYMQEAMTAVFGYGFNTMKLHTIEANVAPENAASIKALERQGFVKEAHFRENFFFNGKFLDTAVYSLIDPADRAG
jgi:[ribosomal protein S5]-alanine N-acetyltransferase